MSKTREAIDFIVKQGTARSVEIAEHIGCGASSVSAMLAPYVADGTLVSCLIERPGQRTCNEYRLSGKAQGNGEFRISDRPAREARSRPRAEKAKPQDDQMLFREPSEPSAPEPVGARFSISCEERLTIVWAGAKSICLEREATRRLARFLRNFVPAEEQRNDH